MASLYKSATTCKTASFPLEIMMDISLKRQCSLLLDQEYKLLHELSTIRSNLNQQCLIISLFPTEILQIIFTFCMPHTDAHEPLPKHRLAFTHVCRHWRALSLGMGSLWSTIDLRDTAFASLYLSRSGESLISLFSKTSCAELVRNLKMDYRTRDRIRKIDVVSFPNALVRLFRNIAGDVLEFPDWRTIRLRNLRDLTVRIPAICDSVDLSSLDVGGVRRLTLCGVRVDWGSTSSDLKVLDLSRLPGRFAPTMQELLGMIERARESIEEFYLEGIFYSGVDELQVPPWTERIDVPCLRRLSISSGNEELMEAVFSVLNVGPRTEVEVRCRGMKMMVVEGRLVHFGWPDIELSTEELSMIGYRCPF